MSAANDVSTGFKTPLEDEDGRDGSGMHKSDGASWSQGPGQLTLNLSEPLTQGHILGCCRRFQHGAPEFRRSKILSLRDHPAPFPSILRPGRRECHHRTLPTGHLRREARFERFPGEPDQFTLKNIAERRAHNVHTGLIDLVDRNNRVQFLTLDEVQHLPRLRHDSVVCSDHQYYDVRYTRSSSSHGRESSVTWRVQECNGFRSFAGAGGYWDGKCANVLGDSTGFTFCYRS